MPSPVANPTPITPPRVPLIDERTGLIDRAWYMFFLNLYRAANVVVNNEDLGPSSESLIASYDQMLRNLAQFAETLPPQVDCCAEIDKIKHEGGLTPSNEVGELQQQINTLRQEVQTQRQPELGSMAPLEQDNVPWLTFNTAPSPVPTAVGSMYWDGGTTMGLQATANVTIRIGESEYVYVKASSAITKGQLCYHTGAVGSSGVITVAPTPLALTDPNQIVGVAAETIALNGFGLIQISGDLRGFNTTGSSVGETWADGDPLYYNPAYVGSFTKTKPSAPNQKTYIGEVTNAGSGGSGSIHIRIVPGSILGGTDSNVQFGTLANNDLIQYDSTAQYWKNVPASTLPVGTATNLAGGAAGSVPYQTGAGATTFLGIGTAAQVLKTNAGATAPEWVSGATLSKTDDTNVTMTLGGSPTTALLAATSMTLGWTGQLAVSRGGTGVSTATANYVFAGPTSGGAAAPSFRALVASDIPSLSYVSSVSGTSPISSSGGTTPTISISQATSSTNGYLSSTDWSTFNAKQPVAAPATKTGDFTVAATEVWLINNKSGSTCTVTLPTASSNTGRVLYFQNYQAQTLVSASSNVVPLAGGSAGTAILAAVAGDTATLVSDGTNWIMTQYVPNNVLLLE